MKAAAPHHLGHSDVARPCFSCRHRHVTVFHENVFLASEGDEDTSCSLSINVAGQRSLAGADGRFLFRAVSTPIHDELVGINDRVQLTGKAEANPYTNGLFKRLRKHRDLLAWHSDAQATATTHIGGHPWQWRADFLKDFGRLREAYEGLLSGGKRIVALIDLLAGPNGSVVDWAAPVFRPFIEKFEGIFQAGDFLNEVVSASHEDGIVKRSFAHHFLQENERVLGFLGWPAPVAATTAINMFSTIWNVKIGEAT
jgi:hypothetical protein